MSAGTIALTNNSKNFTGSGTTFTTELTAGAFVVVTIGQVPYTLAVESVTSNTAAVLSAPFDGPTSSGLAWDGVPVGSMALATMGVTTQAQKAMRMLIADSTNWRNIYSNAASVTVTLPNGQTFVGPSWGYLASNMLVKSQNLNDLANKEAARNNLQLGVSDNAQFNYLTLTGGLSTRNSSNNISPTIVSQVYDTNGVTLKGQVELRANSNGSMELINRTSGTGIVFAMQADGVVSWSGGKYGGSLSASGQITAGGVFLSEQPSGVFRTGTTGNAYSTMSTEGNYTMIWRRYDAAVSGKSAEFFGLNGTSSDYNTRFLFRKATGTGASDYQDRIVLHLPPGNQSGNVTADSNGFIKLASPIVELFGDGTANINGEARGAEVTRIGVGEYQITGVLGLNSDASWGGVAGGIEVPRDVNGQPRLWVDYTVSPTGDLLVKTYHREHSNSPSFAQNKIEGFADGDPIDIPADVFVSVRVEMPGGERVVYEDDLGPSPEVPLPAPEEPVFAD